jgi:hypothetical protein
MGSFVETAQVTWDGQTKRKTSFLEGWMRYNLRSYAARSEIIHSDLAAVKLKREAQ